MGYDWKITEADMDLGREVSRGNSRFNDRMGLHLQKTCATYPKSKEEKLTKASIWVLFNKYKTYRNSASLKSFRMMTDGS